MFAGLFPAANRIAVLLYSYRCRFQTCKQDFKILMLLAAVITPTAKGKKGGEKMNEPVYAMSYY